MATTIKCDKCGIELDFDTRNFISVPYFDGRETRVDTCELCIDCSTKLNTLVKHFVKSGEHEILHKFMTIEDETKLDTEMISIPVEQYDSLNRMIAQYSDEAARYKKCIDTIADMNQKKSKYEFEAAQAILEAKMGMTFNKAVEDFTRIFLKGEDTKDE